jgi:hypothetical protein
MLQITLFELTKLTNFTDDNFLVGAGFCPVFLADIQKALK